MSVPTRPGIEVIHDEDEDEDDPAAPRRRGRTVALLMAGVVVAGLVLSRLGDDEPPVAEPPPAAGALFELDRIDPNDAPPTDRTTYPLFGRPTGRTLLLAQFRGLVAVDLDTGQGRLLHPSEPGFTTTWDSVHLVDNELYATFGWGGLARLDGAGPTVVIAESAPGTFGPAVVGDYAVRTREPFEVEILHLPTGEVVDVATATRIAALGSDLLIERGGTIVRRTTDGQIHEWADGEILAAAPDVIVWRSCRVDECEWWAGGVDKPRQLPLDPQAVVDTEFVGYGFSPFTLTPPVLSAGGRHAIGFRGRASTFRLEAIDLVEDARVELAPRHEWRWLDADLLGAGFGAHVVLADVRTGAIARVPLLDSAGARRESMTVVPTELLPT